MWSKCVHKIGKGFNSPFTCAMLQRSIGEPAHEASNKVNLIQYYSVMYLCSSFSIHSNNILCSRRPVINAVNKYSLYNKIATYLTKDLPLDVDDTSLLISSCSPSGVTHFLSQSAVLTIILSLTNTFNCLLGSSLYIAFQSLAVHFVHVYRT